MDVGDSHHGYTADKSADAVWCCHVNISEEPCWVYAQRKSQFWRKKSKCLVSIYWKYTVLIRWQYIVLLVNKMTSYHLISIIVHALTWPNKKHLSNRNHSGKICLPSGYTWGIIPHARMFQFIAGCSCICILNNTEHVEDKNIRILNAIKQCSFSVVCIQSSRPMCAFPASGPDNPLCVGSIIGYFYWCHTAANEKVKSLLWGYWMVQKTNQMYQHKKVDKARKSKGRHDSSFNAIAGNLTRHFVLVKILSLSFFPHLKLYIVFGWLV